MARKVKALKQRGIYGPNLRVDFVCETRPPDPLESSRSVLRHVWLQVSAIVNERKL